MKNFFVINAPVGADTLSSPFQRFASGLRKQVDGRGIGLHLIYVHIGALHGKHLGFY